MIEQSLESVDETRKWFETSLNEHGYSFQQSLLKAAHNLFSSNKSGWALEVGEFPVEIRGRGTRIDFVLRRARKSYGPLTEADRHMTLMVAECKRANPAYSNWCFAKSQYSFRGHSPSAERLHFESLKSSDNATWIDEDVCRTECSHKIIYHSHEHTYQVAVAVKGDSKTKGNRVSSDPGKDAIEGAASQVCQGLNGLVNFLAVRRNLWEESQMATLIPVIFTTANLWASDADLSSANLETGDVTFSEHGFKRVPWLFFQYNLSPGITHSVPFNSSERKSLADILQAEYIRTIPIVSPSGLEEFLRYATALDFTD